MGPTAKATAMPGSSNICSTRQPMPNPAWAETPKSLIA
jgi:hypothetical protein